MGRRVTEPEPGPHPLDDLLRAVARMTRAAEEAEEETDEEDVAEEQEEVDEAMASREELEEPSPKRARHDDDGDGGQIAVRSAAIAVPTSACVTTELESCTPVDAAASDPP